jgi:acetyltransferase-like isoleucine patch superfamily enzyme
MIISKIAKYRGRLSALLLSLRFQISADSVIFKSIIYGKSKLIIGSKCMLNNCRIIICKNSKYIKIGSETIIENNAFLNAHHGIIEVGKKCFIGPNVIIQGFGGVYIGDNVLIAGNTFISSSNHIFENVTLSEFLNNEIGKKVVIGNNTWIASNVTIVAGVEIGERCVIGAGSVVTKNIPNESLAVGSPAKIIRKIKINS